MVRTAWLRAIAGFLLLLATCSEGSAADDIMATKAAPTASTKAPPQPATCSSPEDFVATNCPLTWNGITVYGTIGGGVTWRSHGAPFNGTSAPGVDYLIQKYSRGQRWDLAPNGLSQSNIGIKGNEPLAAGWAFIFDLQAGFDPYSLHLPNTPHSVPHTATIPLTASNPFPNPAPPLPT